MSIEFDWITGTFAYVDDALVQECSRLYSSHYGKWSVQSPVNPGGNIKLSPSRMREWLDNDASSIYSARDDGELIGYAIAIRIKAPSYGIISWVTQLVVHKDYRNKDIAKRLLYSIWGFSNDFAWGIISANPYAVRALEKATRRRSNPARTKRNIRKIISLGIDNVPYITEETKLFLNNEASKINTNFYVDHSNLDVMLDNVISDDKPWLLGGLDEGWEWLAFTFNDQEQIKLSNIEIREMLEASESVVQNAYSRMNIANHPWAKNTKSEVDFIINECELNAGDKVVDFGCGNGRHAVALAKHGLSVLAIDYLQSRIEQSKKDTDRLGLNIEFICADCRHVNVSNAKAAICLYDVIGTYSNNEDNLSILRSIYNSLDIDGIAIITVMNFDYTQHIAKNKFSLSTDSHEVVSSKLLELPASNLMQETGNIFDPDYFLIDSGERVVYRKEQFTQGRSLPAELIVIDRRFSIDEIVSMCKSVGFEVRYARYVNASSWEDRALSSTDKRSKEILIKCIKCQ